jgi:hypothetical protein
LASAGQSVAWQSVGSGIVAAGSTAAITSAAGIATEMLTVGPLAEGQLATIDACLNGTSQCIAFTAIGARPEYGTLEAVSGTTQSLSVKGTPGQITLRLLDMDGNAMAAGAVSLYQALYAWAPPCQAHRVCALSNLLATETAMSTSALDGTVTFTPATLPGVATDLLALAASGSTSTIGIVVEQHP